MKPTPLLRPHWAVCVGLWGLWLSCLEAAYGTELDPVLKGAWPEYGRANAKAVAVERGFAFMAAGEAGLLVLDVSDPSRPRPAGRLPMNGSASGIALAGDYAYVANEGVGEDSNLIFSGLHIVNIRQPARPVQVGFLATTGRAVEVAVSGTRALVADGGYYKHPEGGYGGTGVEVIEVENPRQPQHIGRIDTPGRVMALAVSGDLACIADEGGAGSDSPQLSVIQLSVPGGPHRSSQLQLYGYEVGGLVMVGNLAYLADALSFQVIDLADPTHPRRLGAVDFERVTVGSSRVAVSGTNAFVVDGAGVVVIDISNPRAPVQKDWQRVVNPENPHSTPLMSGMAMSDGHLYCVIERFVNIGGWEETSLLRVIACSDASHPSLVASHPIGIHTDRLALSGSIALVTGGSAGLQILDVADPARPQLVSGLEMPVADVAIAGNIACLLGFYGFGMYGFDLMDVTDPRQPTLRGRYRLGEGERTQLWPAGITVGDNRAFLPVVASSGPGTDTNYLDVIDISNPDSPRRLLRYETEPWFPGFLASPRFTFVPHVEEGWMILDTTDPANPVTVGGYRTVAAVLGARVSGTRVLDAWGNIFDVSDPAHPQPSDSPDSWADAATQWAVDRWGNSVIMRGTDAFVAAGQAGLLVVDLSGNSSPSPSLPRLDAADLPAGGESRGVAVSGPYAYVAGGNAGLLILDITRAENPTFVGSHDTPGFAQGVAVEESHVYLADGHSGLRIFDVSDPTHPQPVGAIGTRSAATDVVVAGGNAYVSLEGEWVWPNLTRTGLEVIDVRAPANPRSVGGYETVGPVTGMAVSGNRLFVAEMGRDLGRGIHAEGGVDVLDLADPAQPRRVGRFDTPGSSTALAIAGDLLCVVDRGVWTGWNWEGGHLAVVDATDPTRLRELGEYPLGGGAATWPRLAVSGAFAYLVLPSLGGLHVIDFSDPSEPRRANGAFPVGTAMDLAVSSDRLFAAADSVELKAVDITDPSRPRWLGGFDRGGGVNEIVRAGAQTLVAYGPDGVQWLDVSDPLLPRRLGNLVTRSGVADVAVSGSLAYVAETGDPIIGSEPTGGRLVVVDLSDPPHLREVGALELSGSTCGVAHSGHWAFLAVGNRGLQAVDVSNPARPSDAGYHDTDGYALDVAVDGPYAFIADGHGGLLVIDVSTPPVLRRVGGHSTGGGAERVSVAGGRAYVWDNGVGLLAFDIGDAANPRLLDRLTRIDSFDSCCTGFGSFAAGYAAVIDGSGLRVLDLSDPSDPRPIGISSTVDSRTRPVLMDGTVLLLDGSTRLGVVQVPPFIRSISSDRGEVHLAWEGWGKARLERTASLLHPDWRDLQIPENINRASLPVLGGNAFFRLRQP